MKIFLTLLLLVVSTSSQEQQHKIQDATQLVGKKVTVQRMPLCKPGTYTVDLSRAGTQATVISVKPNPYLTKKLSAAQMAKLLPASRDMLEDQYKAGILLLQFEDGSQLDTCAPIGPQRLDQYIEIIPGQTLDSPQQQSSVPLVPTAPTSPQECPVTITKVSSSNGGFGHGLADAMTTSEFERQLDQTIHGGKAKHYLDMRMRNNSQKPIRAFESVVVYSNVMGDESARDSLLTQNKNAIKPGDEWKSYFMDRSSQSTNGQGDVTVYIQRVRFEDNTFWQDNGSHSCSLTSRIKN